MRKIRCLLVGILLISLCACSSAETTYTIEKNGKSYVVETENGTIYDGNYTYEYTFSGNSSSCRIHIDYPNGASYQYQMSDGIGKMNATGDYDSEKYADGDILCEVLLEKVPQKLDFGNVLIEILLAAAGLFFCVFPRAAWYLECGWRFRKADPSDLALGINRTVGIVLIVTAILLLLL